MGEFHFFNQMKYAKWAAAKVSPQLPVSFEKLGGIDTFRKQSRPINRRQAEFA